MLKFLKLKKKDPKEHLLSLLGEFELPSFDITIMNILRLLRDPESSIKEIADQVQIDPGIHVKTLKTVNSAAFGLASKVSSIQHAVSLLGRSRLESIILSVAVKDSLPVIKSSHMDETSFWTIAAKRANLACALAVRLHPATKAETYTAALLQDMAIPVIMISNQGKYSKVLERWATEKNQQLNEIEEEILGYDHATIGALMAEEWQFPKSLVHSVAGHHQENEEDTVDPAVSLVSHFRYDNEDGIHVLKEKCISEFEMSENLVNSIIEDALKNVSNFSN